MSFSRISTTSLSPGSTSTAWATLSVLRILGERFNLHPLALEDVLDTSQRPKVEQYDDYLFIVAKMLYLDKR